MEPTRDPNPAPETPPYQPLPGTAPPISHPPVAPYRPSATDQSQTATGKADIGKRFIAMLIDYVLAFVIGLIPLVGGLIGAGYMMVRDGLDIDFMDKRSLGKKLMKLRPVRLDGQPMDISTSLQRNWMWGIGAIITLLLYIPIIGWILIPVVGLIALGIGIFEIYKVLTDTEGRRWGDTMGGTKVIEVAD